jgi:hypothetical protein
MSEEEQKEREKSDEQPEAVEQPSTPTPVVRGAARIGRRLERGA